MATLILEDFGEYCHLYELGYTSRGKFTSNPAYTKMLQEVVGTNMMYAVSLSSKIVRRIDECVNDDAISTSMILKGKVSLDVSMKITKMNGRVYVKFITDYDIPN